MTVVRRQLEDGGRDAGVGPEKLNFALLRERYFFETFMNEPMCTVPGSGTEPAGTTLQNIRLHTGRYTFEYAFIGDATDAFMPVLATEGGYNWVLTTATVDRGVEVNFGSLLEGHPRNFVPSNEDWFLRVLMLADDVSGLDATLGFRKVGAYVGTLSEYGDVYGVRILGDSSSALGAFSVISNLNNAAATDSYTSTVVTGTLTDAQVIELEVQSVGRKGRAFINGVRVPAASDLTFDTGDVMSPVLRLLQATDLAAQIKTFVAEGGPLACRQPGTLLSLAGATA